MTTTATEGKPIEGIGLITGLPVKITLSPLDRAAYPDNDIVFVVNGTVIPTGPEYAIDTDRGVTLGNDGKTLSIVEHFLSACAMQNARFIHVQVEGAPELPLLDGSAQLWLNALQPFIQPITTQFVIKQPIAFSMPEQGIDCIALPNETLKITYGVNFDHPDLTQRWFSWDSQHDDPLKTAIAPARTFGFMRELPILQERGLAKGVSIDNTLGLTDDGGYTTPLRMTHEPIRHKILDFIGDMMLCGLPILECQAHFMLFKAGHTSHIGFAQQLSKALR